MSSGEEKKYRKISEMIRQKIESGEWSSGSRLPTYRTLAQDFCTTQVTLANAIRELETDGWLRRHPGKGVFVKDSSPEEITDGKRHSSQIGTILGEGDDLFSNLRGAMATLLESQGRYLVGMSSLEAMTVAERDNRIRSFIENDFEALVVYGSRHTRFRTLHRLLRKIRQLNFVVVQDSEQEFPGANRIFFDHRETGRIAARYLLSCGHRRLALLVPGALNERDRKSNGGKDLYIGEILKGFAEILKDAGMDFRQTEVLSTPLHHDDPEEYQHRLEAFCRGGEGGIFATADAYLVPAYKLARRFHVEIGKELNMVGLYDTDWGEILYPELTSIRIHEKEIGHAAAECILNHLENEHIVIQPSLIRRQT